MKRAKYIIKKIGIVNFYKKKENYNRRMEVDIMKMRVVAYARYSSDNQKEENIDAQVMAIKEYAKSK